MELRLIGRSFSKRMRYSHKCRNGDFVSNAQQTFSRSSIVQYRYKYVVIRDGCLRAMRQIATCYQPAAGKGQMNQAEKSGGPWLHKEGEGGGMSHLVIRM